MRILVVRTSSLGDIVHCLPALRALRSGYPDAEIGWVVESAFAPLLERDPDIDRLIPVELRAWRRTPRPTGALAAALSTPSRLRAFEPDVVVDLMGNHKAGLLAALSGSERRVGARSQDRREPSSAMWLSESVPAPSLHAVDQALEVVRALDVDIRDAGFAADKILKAAEGAREVEGSPCVVHPGAAWANKQYPAERWARVARGLVAAGHGPVQLSIGPGEEALGNAILAEAGEEVRIADASSIPELVSLLSQARLVLAGDTGPLHLAHALGVPVLAVMGPTNPETHGPWRAPESVVFHRLDCSFCHRRYATVQRCLLEIPPETVLQRALQRLGSTPRLE